jgi:hypothetical protein
MRSFWSFVLYSIALADAFDLGQELDLDRRKLLRMMRRGKAHLNATISTTLWSTSSHMVNTTSISSTVHLSTTFVPTPTTSSILTPPALPPPRDSITTTTTILTSPGLPPSAGPVAATTSVLTPPPIVLGQGPFTNDSTSIDLRTVTPGPTCEGSITYTNSVPPTVFLTVTEGFDVTVTASNASVFAQPTFVTPLPFCSETVISFAASAATGTVHPIYTGTKTGNHPNGQTNNPAWGGDNPDNPLPPDDTPPPVYTSVAYTSTVIITKKTPVTVVVPPTASNTLNFSPPSNPPKPPPVTQPPPASPTKNGNGGGGNANPPSEVPATPLIFPPGNNGGPLTVKPPSPQASTGIPNIIASFNNLPPVAPSPNFAPAQFAAPFSTAAAGVPIVVLSSNAVAIGSQTVAIPNLKPTTLSEAGAIFTVGPSQIIAPSATIPINRFQRPQIVTPPPTGTITTAVGDVGITVGPTVAVISGTTYRVGRGAPATTLTFHGTQVSIGPGGIGFPSATFAPDGNALSPYVVYTTKGLTFSVGSTDAIVGGTTYRVGSNAPDLTTTIGPNHVSVSFGPGGVGLASTTLLPGMQPSMVVTAEGMTFTVEGTEAIISGTTYRIGSNAPVKTTSIGADHSSVSFGPGGIGLKSTTILPATAAATATHTAQAGSGSTSHGATATQTLASGNSASSLTSGLRSIAAYGALLLVSVIWSIL